MTKRLPKLFGVIEKFIKNEKITNPLKIELEDRIEWVEEQFKH